MNIVELKEMTISELSEVAKKLNVNGAGGLRKQELIFKVLEAQTEKNGLIFGEGVLDTVHRAKELRTPSSRSRYRNPDLNLGPARGPRSL